ncbi:MAG: hypothetical protein HOE45_08155 [Gammaproteobacteria bacterium]|jgi:hypothetical protein|nr:hypothetical protein [Gammaproteobacteria bacterium]MBT5825281.1 hypothetical protein [Gammaproteobacteria bacterium]MBT6419503.1 hypothetical protein [Gammaproteobacteria bacterium]MBT6576641.1 hypothetical protein [Gammaproteobacteria bacterium]MBT7436805.1 hypothetical protein [Gammaproteobacteria bacterium]
MSEQMQSIKIGLGLVMLVLIFGIISGAVFGVAEDSVKSYIAQGVEANPQVHDGSSKDKIWRYAQRAHFHATGIAAFSIGLELLIMFSVMAPKIKTATSILVGLGGLYPLSWFTIFALAPSLGRDAAHHHFIAELFTYVGVGGLLLGIAMLCANLFFGLLQDSK